MSDPIPPTPGSAAGQTRPELHLIQQAEVPPLDVDGIQAATVGTTIFAVVTVVMVIGYDRLAAAGDGWWLWVAISGLALGLIGLGYTVVWRRWGRHRRAAGATLPDRAA